ncbi:hypothetical protein JNB88_31030 [Rhizobium cauense]|uniref:DUF7674 family protein n=1 Tax=Rhizobium cauense TaxID=1166683 RepID=UPI001C6F578B|nr:hypothetical protein [Rhizobium cauense]MBW9118053.1 hypothetical protein [Rhizobium cauense]
MDSKTLAKELTRYIPCPIEVESSSMQTVFEEMGWRIAENFSAIEERDKVFDLIEFGMRNGDRRLRNVVSTGLIEAMISRTGAQPARWRQISSHLGALSAAYAHG